jgi:hypothetical protein
MTTSPVHTVWTVKIVVSPVDHFAGPRLSRRTWTASIVRIADGEVLAECGHHGHPTPEYAVACGKRLYRATAAAGPEETS